MNNSLTKAEFVEASNDFTTNNNVNLLNPLSKDLSVLRQSLLFGGLETVAYNINRKLPNLGIFEFGKTYSLNHKFEKSDGIKNYIEEKHLMILATGKASGSSWGNSDKKVDIYNITGIVNSVFTKMGILEKLSLVDTQSDSFNYSLQYILNENILADVSIVSKKLLNQFDIRQEVICADINWTKLIRYSKFRDVAYKPVSKFPAVKRDLSLVLDKHIRFNELRDAAMKIERKLLKNVDLFDIYEGSNISEGKKSYALSFILQDESSTLTDKIIDKTMKRILTVYEQQFSAQLR